MKNILFTLVLISGLNYAHADTKMEKATKEMSNLIETEVVLLDGGLEENNFFETNEAISPFNFSGFELLTVTSFGVEVPFANIEVFIEMEMVWAKVDR